MDLDCVCPWFNFHIDGAGWGGGKCGCAASCIPRASAQTGTPKVISPAGVQAQRIPDTACAHQSNYLSPVHEWFPILIEQLSSSIREWTWAFILVSKSQPNKGYGHSGIARNVWVTWPAPKSVVLQVVHE